MIGRRRVLLKRENREYFVIAGDGKLSTDLGMVDLKLLSELNDGDEIFTHLGKSFRVLIPRASDFFTHGKRTGAPMMPKDIGCVIAYTGMSHNDRVLDAGTGSGIAAIFFGGAAKNVVTCEVREEFSKIAEKNITDAHLDNVECRACDFTQVDDGPYDIVHLDMQIEKEHIVHAYSLLKFGGYLACYTPFLEQTFTVIDSARELFGEDYVTTFECMERELSKSKRGTRPSTRVGHTGFITIARKY